MPPTCATMTMLLTDIEGSTRQWEQSPAMAARVDEHFEVLRRSIEDAGGTVFATMGDGVAAAFVSAEAAVRAAVSAQRALPATGLAVRMGIHTGEVERAAGDIRGRPVNRAARIMAAGHGGQILVSDVTAVLLRAGPRSVTLLDVGTHRLRDLDGPERLWQVGEPGLPTEFPPIRGDDPPPAPGLPAPRSALVGRGRDGRRVRALLARSRIVTLTGVGGVGKTRLALHAAAELGEDYERIGFVELARVTDPADVAGAIARSIGVPVAADPIAAVALSLAGRATLLVVDNCEHVVDAAARAVDALAAACPTLAVLATSRERLGIDGEHVIPVQPLAPPLARQLFEERAAAAGADVRALPPIEVAEVCRRLDGLPLAIELAAARAGTLDLGAIVGGLADRIRPRFARCGHADDRHRTMGDTIEWSYRLLDDGEQRLFRRLAVFPADGFELDAAVHVARSLGIDEDDAVTHVASLVHKSMLVAEPGPAGMRYRMLEVVRAYGTARLDDLGERADALTALARWVTTITDLPYADACSAAVERHCQRLEREVGAWREAAVTAAHLRSGELAAALCGPPVAFFLLGRHDLADLVPPLLDVCTGPLQRRAVLAALVVSSATADPGARLSWAHEVEQAEDVERTGLGSLMRWLALAWAGDIASAVEVCVTASRDERLAPATRDLFVAIAVLDNFSLTDARDDEFALVPRAVEVAERSPVALARVSCRLGVAWSLAEAAPARAVELIRLALRDIDSVPPMTRVTLPGSAARLLGRLDPKVAARGLLEQLGGAGAPRSFVDLIPLGYAGALLHRLGHAAADDVLASLSVAPVARSLSMMDVVDVAWRAAASRDAVALGELESTVREALAEIAGG